MYLLTATTANGCTASATAEVLSDTIAPGISLTGGTISCNQPSLLLSAALVPDSATIIWSGPLGFSATIPNPSTNLSGNYTAIATLPNGCTNSASTMVLADTISPQISITSGTLTCTDPNLTLTSTVQPGNSDVQWSGPLSFSSMLLSPNVDVPGNYTLLATALNGCTSSQTVLVDTDTSAPAITTSGGTITCDQPQVVLITNITPASASGVWSGPQSFSSSETSPSVPFDGTYTVLATGANGCTSTATASVLIDTLSPQISAVSGGLLTCLQNTLMLGASVQPASSSLLWSGPSGFSSTDLNPTVSVAGDYVLMATSLNGCTSSATANVTADSDFPVVNVSGGTITCTQPIVTLSGSVTPVGTTIDWSGPLGFSSTQPNPAVDVSGNYILTATTNAGCTATATAVVLLDTLAPLVSAIGTEISCQTPTGSISVQVDPITSTIQWTGPDNFSATSANPAVDLPGQYTATVTGPNGCASTISTTVTADTTAPQLTISGGTISCSQPELQLQLSVSPGGSTIQWTGPQNFMSTELMPLVNTPGDYTAVATANNGCTATAMTTVDADVGLPSIDLNGGLINCTMPSLILTPMISPAGGTLTWTGPAGFSSNLPQPEVSTAGTYTLTVTLPNGCTASANAIVEEDFDLPEISLSGNDITCVMDSALLEAIVQPSSSSVLWSGPQGFSSTATNPIANRTGQLSGYCYCTEWLYGNSPDRCGCAGPTHLDLEPGT